MTPISQYFGIGLRVDDPTGEACTPFGDASAAGNGSAVWLMTCQ